MTTTTQPTLEEQVQALKETAARLAAERDVARQMASATTKELVRTRDELKVMQTRIDARDRLIESLRINDDRKTDSLRRLTAYVRELALTNENQLRRLDRAQQEPQPVRNSWWSRRIGNQL